MLLYGVFFKNFNGSTVDRVIVCWHPFWGLSRPLPAGLVLLLLLGSVLSCFAGSAAQGPVARPFLWAWHTSMSAIGHGLMHVASAPG